MPSTSKKQQRFMGMVHAHQKGELDMSGISAAGKKKIRAASSSMTMQQGHDYASTKHKGLPEKKAASDYFNPPQWAYSGAGAAGGGAGGFLAGKIIKATKRKLPLFAAAGALGGALGMLGAHKKVEKKMSKIAWQNSFKDEIEHLAGCHLHKKKKRKASEYIRKKLR